MLLDGARIKKYLEETFDIPFTVNKASHSGEPFFLLAPKDPGKEFFAIKVSFRNKVRLSMDFIPQKYSVSFVRAMGQQTEEKKKLFIGYIKAMKNRGAKCTVKVNGNVWEPNSALKWPENWTSFEARATKMPVVNEGEFVCSEVVIAWIGLMMGMILSLADIVPIDIEPEQTGYYEGASSKAEVTRYERNPLNRKLCLAEKGYGCTVCEMRFEDTYGEIGRDFIHVHHIVPVSQMGEGYVINPARDLVPVCPNCHAMLHKVNPPLKPEQLKEIMNEKMYKSVRYSELPEKLKVADKSSFYGMAKERRR